MRVLHVVEATIAGVRTHVQALVAGLDRRRFAQAVACPPQRENAFGDAQFVAYLAGAGVPVFDVPMRRSISPSADLASLRRLIAIMRRERFDVVHLHSSKAGFLGRLAAALAGRSAVVYSPHGLAFLGDYGEAERAMYLTLERVAGRLCDRIVAVSPGEREVIIQSGIARAEQVACIDLGVHPDPIPAAFDREAQRRALGVPTGARLIGTVARATRQKNPLLFVEAAARVLRRDPGAYFVWCGDGELRAQAEMWAGVRGIEARCRFLGHREDAQAILAALDLFWLTSDYESFGLATAEAMALRLPVVATDVVGTRDVVAAGISGMLVPARDPEALAHATIDLLRDPARMRSLGDAGRARVLERYTLDHMLDATAKLYDSLFMEQAQRRAGLRGMRTASSSDRRAAARSAGQADRLAACEQRSSTNETAHNYKP